MAEFYSEYGRSEKRPRRNPVLLLLDLVMTLLSAAAAVAMGLLLFVPYVHPDQVRFFPLLGLIAPAVYLTALLFALYWVIRWRKVRAGILLLLLLLGAVRIPLFYNPQFRRTYDEDAKEQLKREKRLDRESFKIVTYNVRGLYNDRGADGTDSIAAFLERIRPDVICLQEFNPSLAARSAAFSRLAEQYRQAGHPGGPMIVLSKFPVLGFDTLCSIRSSMWADLKIGDDTVRIYNNHLHSTSINAADDHFITHHLLDDSTREEKVRSIIRRHSNTSALRADQVDSLAPMLQQTGHRRIVCGDFNDTPMSYVYHTMADGLHDAFSTCGRGYSHTYRGFFNVLRIDYLLYSDGLEALTYEVPPVKASDHHPVVVRIKVLPKTD